MATINLWAKEGHLSTPDGNSIYFWGFSKNANEHAQIPGPHIIAKQGEMVTVNLTNTLSEPVSLTFSGQQGVTVNGQPVQPQYSNGQLVSFVNFALPGGTISYTFTAAHPGTYIYESGTSPHKQVQMGLYGGMVIRPADFDPMTNKTAYGAGTNTEYDREYLLILNEVDADLHQDVKEGKTYSVSKFWPHYWTMNGRCAPDTMHMDHVDELPHQPYDSMIMAKPGEKVLLRYIGAGVNHHPMHLHGNHTRIIALDGRLLKNGPVDRSYKRFTVVVSPGQTYDQIFQWTGLGYTPNNPIPTILPQLRNMEIGTNGSTMWSGSPYLGVKGDIPVSVQSFNEFGEYHFMLHSHSEPSITNWGEFPGGLMTMLAIYTELSQQVGQLDSMEGGM